MNNSSDEKIRNEPWADNDYKTLLNGWMLGTESKMASLSRSFGDLLVRLEALEKWRERTLIRERAEKAEQALAEDRKVCCDLLECPKHGFAIKDES